MFLKAQLHQTEAPMNHSDATVQEWEAGLPAPEELMPLTQTLIPHDLASAFKIIPDPPTSASEVQIASENTLAVLGLQRNSSSSLDDAAAHPRTSYVQENHSLPATANFPFIPDKAAENSLPPVSFLDHGLSSKGLKLEAGLWNPGADQQRKSPSIRYEDITAASNSTAFISLDRRVENGYGSGMGGGGADSSEGGSGKKLRKRLDIELEDVDSSVGLENSNEEPTARTLKRPRLVWTPQLHKRFVDAVAHLGIKNAVPKTIMQLMNVEGLTRENVASHLQKYRLYLKRMQGLSTEGPSVSDHLFASTPVPPSLAASAHFLSNHGEDLIPLLMPMPMAGMGPTHMVGSLGLTAPYANFDHNVYNGLVRPSSSQRFPSGDQEFVMDSQGRPGSPQRRVLTLFPTSGS